MAQERLLNNRYRLLAQHGAGGMAVIYKAQDIALDRLVAVKILRPSLTKDEAFLNRFRQEARAAARLDRHPNLVTVHDFGQDGSTYYMVMEFVEGQDLKRLIRAEAPFRVERALDIAVQVCAGVGYAHRANLVHADVKPQNVLVTEEGIVKVTDFGIARAFTTSLPGPEQRLSVVWGSPHYFAPEQAQGTPPSPASDVYAIGVMLFEMLTGRLPFVGKDHNELAMAHVHEQPPFASDLNPQVPHNLSRIIHKIMSKEPSARYRTADQLGRILAGYLKRSEHTTDGDRDAAQKTQLPASKRAPDPQPTVPAPARAAAPPAPSPKPQPAPVQVRVRVSPGAPASPPAQPTQPGFPAASPYDEAAAPGVPERSWPRQIDWLAVGLGLLALLSILGLIPLWTQVYRLWVILGNR
ncbi:MAG: serine/threonine protein kinase [Anaerolineae bacterium]|nr:serine/threonine protein kinase [Anaerolineae bacterium]